MKVRDVLELARLLEKDLITPGEYHQAKQNPTLCCLSGNRDRIVPSTPYLYRDHDNPTEQKH